MILVVGATGLLGFDICRQLLEAGHDVRAFVRTPSSARVAELASLRARTFTGDLKDTASLRLACSGVTSVVTTATAISRPGRADTIERVDRNGQLALVDAAVQGGVRRFVYISMAPSRAVCPFVRYKREVEAAVRSSGMQWVNLQPSAFMDVWLSPAMGWNLERGRARVFGDGRARTSYIAVRDVAAFAVLAATGNELINRDLVLGGPEALSGLQVVAICEELTGRPFKVQRVPIAVLRAAGVLLRRFDPKVSSLMTMGATAAAYGDAVDMEPILREVPRALCSVREYLKAVVGGRAVAGTGA